jgi:hypothetical protein
MAIVLLAEIDRTGTDKSTEPALKGFAADHPPTDYEATY